MYNVQYLCVADVLNVDREWVGLREGSEWVPAEGRPKRQNKQKWGEEAAILGSIYFFLLLLGEIGAVKPYLPAHKCDVVKRGQIFGR